jgi:signal transduction histidine kinase
LSKLHALRLGFGAMTALLVFSAVEAFRIQNDASRHTNEIYQRFVQKGKALSQVRRLLFLASIFTRDLFLRPQPNRVVIFKEQVALARKESNAAITELERLTGSDTSTSELKTHINGLWAKLESVPSWAEGASAATGFDFVMREVVPRRNAAGDLLTAYAEANQRALEASEAEFSGSRRTAANRLLFILGVTIGLGSVVAFLSLAHTANLERQSEMHLDEVTKTQQELQRLSARLLEIQEDERTRLSRELHDEIGQNLHALRLEISQARTLLQRDEAGAVARLDQARGLAERVVASVRNISLLLRPSLLDDLGLAPALQWLAEDFSRRSGIQCALEDAGLPDELPDTRKTCVYRVVQEALHNCEKHSGASNVRVRAQCADGQLLVSIEDDGRGFDAGAGPTCGTGGLGLLGIRERAAMLGGSFTLDSNRGRGARLTLSLPLEDPAGQDNSASEKAHA